MQYENALKLALVVPFVFAAGCADPTGAPAPAVHAPPIAATDHRPPLASLTCTASVQERTVTCASPDAAASAAASAAARNVVVDGQPALNVIFGGQNQYVTLAATRVPAPADTFAIDVTVKNLIPQPIGTTSGTVADPAGVRVFFSSGTTSTTGGTVVVANPDGTATFTAAGQPYFQYNGLLAQDAVTATKQWKFQLTPDVTNFTFTVYISAEVQYPDGYVDGIPYVLALDPGEIRTLPGAVRTFLGDPDADQTITWVSDVPATASVTGTQVTAGTSRGFATLTATAGAAPAIYPTSVSVCQSTAVFSGSNLVSSIASSDCFSTFGSTNGQPTTSYYADIYRVTIPAGKTITITMDSGDDLDTYLLLADSLGVLVAGNDDDDEGVLGVGSRLVFIAPATGVYFIESSTFNGLDTGSYVLGVTIN